MKTGVCINTKILAKSLKNVQFFYQINYFSISRDSRKKKSLTKSGRFVSRDYRVASDTLAKYMILFTGLEDDT